MTPNLWEAVIFAGFVDNFSLLHPAFFVSIHVFSDTVDDIRKSPILIFINIFIYFIMKYPFSILYFYPGEEVSHSIEACSKYSSIISIPCQALAGISRWQ